MRHHPPVRRRDPRAPRPAAPPGGGETTRRLLLIPIAASGAALFLLPGPAARALGLALYLVGFVAVGPRQRWGWFAFGLTTLALGAVLYALALPGEHPHHWGPLAWSEDGLARGALEMFRALGFFAAGTISGRLLRMEDLWRIAQRRPRVLYVFASLGRLLPSLREDYERIRRSQRARGLDARRAWRSPAALLPILVPLFVNALRRSRDQAWSLHLAGLQDASDP